MAVVVDPLKDEGQYAIDACLGFSGETCRFQVIFGFVHPSVPLSLYVSFARVWVQLVIAVLYLPTIYCFGWFATRPIPFSLFYFCRDVFDLFSDPKGVL